MRQVSERTLLFLIGAVQAVNILDFMMVMPMGPFFAEGLGFSLSQVSWLGGSYTASAAISGIACSFFLDRFDRRRALGLSLLGLVLGTVAGGFATSLHTLMAARVIAGAFGGPATSVAMSIIADVFPPERRGRALGAVMGAFSVASVFGVPAGLKLAQLGGWQLPFFGVGAVAFLVTLAVIALLPPMTGHLERVQTGPRPSPLKAVSTPLAALSLVTTILIFTANFAIVPNIAGYLQNNLGYPANRMDVLYGAGGAASFLVMQLVGRLVDRFGAPPVATFGAAVYIAILFTVFVTGAAGLPVLPLFIGFMCAQSFRMVPMNALTSRVPQPAERASFMSAQSAAQHLASAGGAFLSTAFLTELPDHRLAGMDRVAMLAITLSAVAPALLVTLNRWVLAREAAAASLKTAAVPVQ